MNQSQIYRGSSFMLNEWEIRSYTIISSLPKIDVESYKSLPKEKERKGKKNECSCSMHQCEFEPIPHILILDL